MEQKIENPQEGKLDYFLFITTFLLIASGIVWGVIDNSAFVKYLTVARDFITTKFAWFMIIAINTFLGVLFYLAFSRHGDKKLGKKDDKPEFSTFSWIALLFGCGIGAGYCFWPIGEPLWHYFSSPYITESQTPEALTSARGIALFHWGFHLWTLWCIAGLAIAYPAFRLNKPMTISVALYGMLGDRVYTSFWGRIAELCGAFAALTGVSAALGLGLLLFTAGLRTIFGLEVGVMGQIIIMAVIIVIYTTAAWTGLDKGIKFLGDSNAWICITWFVAILLLGPTSHLLDGMVETWSFYLSNMLEMSTFTDSAGETNNWSGSWTLFYYLWNTAWAPFVGGFIARISRGRTIREYILGVLFIPVIITFIWFGVLGTAAQYVELNQITNLWEQVQAEPAMGIYAVIDALGGGTILKIIVFLSVGGFLVTSADSAAFFVAMQMNRGTLDPSKLQMLFWSILIGALAIVLQSVGGITGIQLAGVIAGAPFIVIMCFMVYSFFKLLAKEEREQADNNN